MRWDALFADLEDQLDAAQNAEFTAAVAEASRLEASRLEFAERLRAHQGRELFLLLADGAWRQVRIGAVGVDWVSGAISAHSVLVPLSGILAVDGMARSAARAELGAARRRLGIMAPLRRLARDRSPVSVYGAAGLLAQGLIATAGRDFLEISELPGGDSPHRGGPVRGIRAIPIHAVAWFQSDGVDLQ